MQQQVYSNNTSMMTNTYNNPPNTQSNSKFLQLKYKINYLKLKRITELNQNLKQELLRDRITSSNASLQIINYTNDLFKGKDYTVPSVSGYTPQGTNPLLKTTNNNNGYSQNGGNNSGSDPGCCTIM